MKQRTDADRFEFVCRLRLDVNHVSDIDGNLDHIEISAGDLRRAGIVYTDETHCFKDFRKAIDFLMDMHELGKEGYFDR